MLKGVIGATLFPFALLAICKCIQKPHCLVLIIEATQDFIRSEKKEKEKQRERTHSIIIHLI